MGRQEEGGGGWMESQTQAKATIQTQTAALALCMPSLSDMN